MQPDPVALKALAHRVEAGERGRGLDAEIAATLTKWRDQRGLPQHTEPPAFTTSLDAVEALRVRLLPSSVLSVFSWNDGFGTSLLRPGGDRKAVHVFAATETAARLAALLNAVAAKVEAEGGQDG